MEQQRAISSPALGSERLVPGVARTRANAAHQLAQCNEVPRHIPATD